MSRETTSQPELIMNEDYFCEKQGTWMRNYPLSQDTDEYIAYLNGGPSPEGFSEVDWEDQDDILIYHFLLRRNEMMNKDYHAGRDHDWTEQLYPVYDGKGYWEPFWTWKYDHEPRSAMDGPKNYYPAWGFSPEERGDY